MHKNLLTHKSINLLIIFFAVAAIVSALVLEYFFNILPCRLCTYQRILWLLLTFVAAVNLRFCNKSADIIKRLLFIIIVLLLVTAIVISVYQSGTIYGLWQEVYSCSSSEFDLTKATISLDNVQLSVPCNSLDQTVFALPLPVYNTILNGVLLFVVFLFLKSKATFKN